MEVRSPRIDAIAREVLTWIERMEADAVAFGIVEATMRGHFERSPAGLARLRFGVDAAPTVDAALRRALTDGLEVDLVPRRLAQLGDRVLEDEGRETGDRRIEVVLGLLER